MIGGSGLKYLDDQRCRDLELAVRIEAECERPVLPWKRDVVGLTKGRWSLHASSFDPELQADDDSEAA